MSFMPFLAGKRVCVGKTFAENSFKVVMPLILKAFKRINFVNPAHYQEKPLNNIAMIQRPEILLDLYTE
jgi:cytochrome P450